MSERASEFITCKKDLEEEEKGVQEEIVTLEKKLQQLKERRRFHNRIGSNIPLKSTVFVYSDLLMKIQSEQEKIDCVSKEFSSEHSQLEEEQARVDKKEHELKEQVVININHRGDTS